MKQKCSVFNLQEGRMAGNTTCCNRTTRGRLLSRQALLSHRRVCVPLTPPAKQLTLPSHQQRGEHRHTPPERISSPLKRHTGSIRLLNSCPPPLTQVSLGTLHAIGLKQSASTLSSSSLIRVQTQFYLKRNLSSGPEKTLSFSI